MTTRPDPARTSSREQRSGWRCRSLPSNSGADHPVVGPLPLPSMPFRYESIDRWLRTPAPTVGEHNERVLCGILGLSPADLRELGAEQVIGTGPRGL